MLDKNHLFMKGGFLMSKIYRAFVVFLIIILILVPSRPTCAATLQDEVEANLNATNYGNPEGTLQDVITNDLRANFRDYQKQLKLIEQTIDEQAQQKTAASKHAKSIQESINFLKGQINNNTQTIDKQKQSFGWRLRSFLVWLLGSKFISPPGTKMTQQIQLEQQQVDNLNFNLQTQTDLIMNLNKKEKQNVEEQTATLENIETTQRYIAGQAREKTRLLAQEKSDQAIAKITVPIKSNIITQLLAFAKTFFGSPYIWGGSIPNPGFDCSGYVQYIYNHFGIKLDRVTWDQYQEGQSVAEYDLKPGDLVFFTTYAPGASHVGIYVGNRLMIDDSGYGVAYDSLDHPYWATRYLGARRVIN